MIVTRPACYRRRPRRLPAAPVLALLLLSACGSSAGHAPRSQSATTSHSGAAGATGAPRSSAPASTSVSAWHFIELKGAGRSPTDPRINAVAATLPSGQVLIAGGLAPGSRHRETGFLSSAELFNPATDTFTKLTGLGQSLTEARFGAVAATLPDGRVLITGGRKGIAPIGLGNPEEVKKPYHGPSAVELEHYDTSAELFDPTTDTFTRLTGQGRSPVEARSEAVAATLPSGEVLIAAGTGGHSNVNILRSVELFDPATETFSKLTGPGQSLLKGREDPVAAALPDGQVLIAGGGYAGVPLTSAELFNPATDRFTKLTGKGQSLREARVGAVAAMLPSGEVLIAGGGNQRGLGLHVIECGKHLASAEIFNPVTDTFTKLSGKGQSLPEARENAVAATLSSGQVLIAGGQRTWYRSGECGWISLLSAELFSSR